jgi:pimeloyl-ACP methyl ester carboxylesterase
MKKIINLILLTTLIGFVSGQSIVGSWNGAIKVSGKSLRIVFHIVETDSGYMATSDSPDQSVYGFPLDQISFENNNLKIRDSRSQFYYSGTLKNDTIKGSLKQKGATFPLHLTRGDIEKPRRPQEPQKPYPYYEEEVKFDNPTAPGVTLAGTLTLPQQEGVFPAVILISGSGQQNRNEEMFGHKPFLVIADFLTRNGFAVLRYDDRGAAASTGVADTCNTYDFSTDAEAAFQYLQTRKEINLKQIGFIGHSEGGTIAPMVAARKQDVAFVILLAAPGLRGDSLMFLQTKLQAQSEGASEEELKTALDIRVQQNSIIFNTENVTEMANGLTELFKEYINTHGSPLTPQKEKDEWVKRGVLECTTNFYRYLIKYDPAPVLAQVKCPVLALNGGKDTQIAADENLNAIQKILHQAGNSNVTIKKFPDLNHLFQTAETGAISEYGTIEETFSQEVLEVMLNWLKEQYKIK